MPPKKRKDAVEDDANEKQTKKTKTTTSNSSATTSKNSAATTASAKRNDDMILTKMIKTRKSLKLKDKQIDAVLSSENLATTSKPVVTFEMENVSTFKDVLKSLAEMYVELKFLVIVDHMDHDNTKRSYLRISQMDKGNTYMGEMMYEIKNVLLRRNSKPSNDDGDDNEDLYNSTDVDTDNNVNTTTSDLDIQTKKQMQAGYEISASFVIEISSFNKMVFDAPGDESVRFDVYNDFCKLYYTAYSNTCVSDGQCVINESSDVAVTEPAISDRERFVVLKLSTDFLKKHFAEEKVVYDVGCVLGTRQSVITADPLIKDINNVSSAQNVNSNVDNISSKTNSTENVNSIADPNVKIKKTQLAIFSLQAMSLETREGKSQRITGLYEFTKPQKTFDLCNGLESLRSGQHIDPIVFFDQDTMLERRLKQDSAMFNDLAHSLKSILLCRLRGELMKKLFSKVVDTEVLLFIPIVEMKDVLIWRYQLGDSPSSRATMQYYIPFAEEEPDQL